MRTQNRMDSESAISVFSTLLSIHSDNMSAALAPASIGPPDSLTSVFFTTPTPPNSSHPDALGTLHSPGVDDFSLYRFQAFFKTQ